MRLLRLPEPERSRLTARAKALVFEDPLSRGLLDRMERVAPSEAPILITGETGTGKEIVARFVHERSARCAGPFVAVNCGALSESLVESELFGHERGAFTGAAEARAGWFEAANGGTLFLDEVGDLPPSTQVKLLRVLQEREVVRVGSRQPVPIDVRVVAATNVELDDAVVAGHFRADLYYRLNVATLRLLPLRERPGDIVPLARHFLDSYARRLGRELVSLDRLAEARLVEHDWPGNIRELENAIHQALLVCDGDEITSADLPLAARPTSRARPDASPFAALDAALRGLLDRDLPVSSLYAAIEERLFRVAYEHAEQNQLQTARLLGLSRNVVRARLTTYGLLVSPRLMGALERIPHWLEAGGRSPSSPRTAP